MPSAGLLVVSLNSFIGFVLFIIGLLPVQYLNVFGDGSSISFATLISLTWCG